MNRIEAIHWMIDHQWEPVVLLHNDKPKEQYRMSFGLGLECLPVGCGSWVGLTSFDCDASDTFLPLSEYEASKKTPKQRALEELRDAAEALIHDDLGSDETDFLGHALKAYAEACLEELTK